MEKQLHHEVSRRLHPQNESGMLCCSEILRSELLERLFTRGRVIHSGETTMAMTKALNWASAVWVGFYTKQWAFV